MVEQGWIPSEIMQAHIQDLMSQGFMTVVELVTYCVPEDPASPAPAEGYVVTFAAFYERGFGVPSHRFLCSLLKYYGLELHHLTPLGMLHIATFVMMCEALIGIDPHFDLWNHFFCAQLPWGSGAEAVVSGGMDIHVKSRHDVDPYFDLPMPRFVKRWHITWFFLRNDVAAPLPVLMGNCPVPHPNWEYKVAKKDLHKLQPLCELVQQLQQEGLTNVHLL
jgi:hypothetical protein